jgi:hypothetical protein
MFIAKVRPTTTTEAFYSSVCPGEWTGSTKTIIECALGIMQQTPVINVAK